MTDKINLVVGEWEVISAGSQKYHYLSYILYQEDINLYNSLERFVKMCVRKNIYIVDTSFVKLLKPYAREAHKRYGKEKFFEGVKRLVRDIMSGDDFDKFEELYVEDDKENYRLR
jgi:hypothetical protein